MRRTSVSTLNSRRIWREVVALLNDGVLDLSFLVTHRYPLAGWDRALSAVRTPSGARAKVVLDPLTDADRTLRSLS